MLEARYFVYIAYVGLLAGVLSLLVGLSYLLKQRGKVALVLIGFSVIPLTLFPAAVARRWIRQLSSKLDALQLIAQLSDFLWELKADEYRRTMLSQPKYQDPKRLNKYEAKIYSQAGEDGMLAEVFRRIGTTNRFFVEFGVGDGFENNTVYLLRHCNWSGLWMDGSAEPLKFDRAFITAENIESLLSKNSVPPEFDLLSIDIDGNDYWVWSRIEHYRPRAVIIEYNAIFPPGVHAVMKYDPQHYIQFGTPFWFEQPIRFGASLTAYALLGKKKGYELVGCNIGGVDAIFVRNDLVGDKFLGPFTAETHYERPMLPFQASKGGSYRRKPM